MPRLDAGPAAGSSCRSVLGVHDLSTQTLALVGTELPTAGAPGFDRRLAGTRRRLEALVVADATTAAEATRACALLLRIDALQRERSRLRLAEIAEYEAFRALIGRLSRMPAEELQGTGAAAVCAEMGFPRALYSTVTGSMWTPRTLHLEPGSGIDADADAVRTFVTDATWPLRHAPLESQVVRRRTPTLVEHAQESRRTFRALMDVTGSRSYVVAPVRAHRQVVGLLHGDRATDGVDRGDLERLEAYAQGFGAVLERAQLERRIRALAERAATALEHAADELRSTDRDALPFTDPGPSLGSVRPVRPVRPATAPPRPRDGHATGSAPVIETDASARLANLSPREFDVLAELSRGSNTATVAGRLGLAEGTVKCHVANVLRKLGVHSRAAAMALLAVHEGGQDDDGPP